jgi:hypothetical protein
LHAWLHAGKEKKKRRVRVTSAYSLAVYGRERDKMLAMQEETEEAVDDGREKFSAVSLINRGILGLSQCIVF